ncbi:MAG: 2-phospho-L-lactate transferase [Actinomycetota bacterium]
MLVALAGGIGAARFLRGMVAARPPSDLTVIVNTGDDIVLHGLYVSPDIDSITYTLAGAADSERGWGLAGESFACRAQLAAYGEPTWFSLGDRDLATHLVRTRMLAEGRTLSEVTAEIARRWDLECRILPMCDEHVETRVVIQDGSERRDVHFQEYWVGRGAHDPVVEVRYAGIETSHPAPGVLDAIARCQGVVVCPSNPIVSIGTILAVPGIREALRSCGARIVAVSPIVGGAPVRGMADKLMPAAGVDVSALGVARLYADILDGFVLDSVDADQVEAVEALGIKALATQSIMRTHDDAVALAEAALSLL